MKGFFARLLFVFAATVAWGLAGMEKAMANHAMGADLSYVCTDSVNRVYHFTYNFYRDCAGGTPAGPIVILYARSSCNAGFTVNLNQESCGPTYYGQPCEASPVCRSYTDLTTCSGGTYPGITKHTYTGTVTLPVACTDWTFSTSIMTRNAAITNLANPVDENLYVEATMDNTLAANNSSPVFATSPVPIICVTQPFSYSHSALDADGDSLVYTLVNPLGNAGVPIAYNIPYTPTSPLTTTGPFVFENITGQMSFMPGGLQVAVIAVRVQEYRNAKLIGSTMRDMQLVIVNLPGCAEPAPVYSGVIQNTVQGGQYTGPYTVEVCAGNTATFSTFATSSPGDSVYITSNIQQAIPGGQLQAIHRRADSVTGTFTLPTAGLPLGQYTVVVTIKNNNCPLVSTQAYTIAVNVIGGTYAGPDVTYCTSSGPVQLGATGGTGFTWTPADGLSNAAIDSPAASPAQTTTYIVSSNLSAGCKNKDTVVVTRSVFDVTLTPSDTFCTGAPIQLLATGGNRYQWLPDNGSLDCTTCPNPQVVSGNQATYYVQVSDSVTGCSLTDSVQVTIESLILTPAFSDTTVNSGDTVKLGVLATGSSNQFNYLWLPATYLDSTSVSSPTSIPLAPLTYTVYVSSGPCVDSAAVNVNVLVPGKQVEIPTAFTPNGDNMNDDFGPVIYNNMGQVKTFRVYNRYGQLVHNSTSNWKGQLNGADQPTGTYMYYMLISLSPDDERPFNGSVSLLR